jgi:hypothetical protein
MSSWEKKLNSELKDETRYSLAPIEQMLLLAAVSIL